MIELSFVNQFMHENFELVKPSKHGTHFLARCPICGDSKKSKYKRRFNLDWNNGDPQYHCFNCDASGGMTKIYSIIKGISKEDAYNFLYRKYDRDRVEERLAPEKKEEEVKPEKTEYDFIRDESYSLPWFTYQADEGYIRRQYLGVLAKFYEDRKIPKEYELLIAHTGKYKNRIIIPIVDENGSIRYFQGRRIPGTGLSNKYYNPPDPKELIIVNEHKLNGDSDIIVCEGLIDVYTVGDQATSCLGKYISEDFLKRLFQIGKNVIIALDNDESGYKSLSRFMVGDSEKEPNKYSKKVKYFLYPSEFKGYDDINSYRVGKNVENVYDLITQNSVDYYRAITKLTASNLLGGKE